MESKFLTVLSTAELLTLPSLTSDDYFQCLAEQQMSDDKKQQQFSIAVGKLQQKGWSVRLDNTSTDEPHILVFGNIDEEVRALIKHIAAANADLSGVVAESPTEQQKDYWLNGGFCCSVIDAPKEHLLLQKQAILEALADLDYTVTFSETSTGVALSVSTERVLTGEAFTLAARLNMIQTILIHGTTPLTHADFDGVGMLFRVKKDYIEDPEVMGTRFQNRNSVGRKLAQQTATKNQKKPSKLLAGLVKNTK